MLKFSSIVMHRNTNHKGQRTQLKIRFVFCQTQLVFTSHQFLLFAGKTFVAPWSKDQNEVKKMFPVTFKSNSGGNKSSQSAALCQWSEVPQHPGLVCCLTHTSGVPVVLMIKPHQILVGICDQYVVQFTLTSIVSYCTEREL